MYYKKENYNLLQLNKMNDGENTIKGQGITYDLSASDYLKSIGCDDPRVGRHNVLKLTHTALNFERIFVFYDSESHSFDHIKAHENLDIANDNIEKMEQIAI